MPEIYDSNKTYKVGDVVQYGDDKTLYRCVDVLNQEFEIHGPSPQRPIRVNIPIPYKCDNEVPLPARVYADGLSIKMWPLYLLLFIMFIAGHVSQQLFGG